MEADQGAIRRLTFGDGALWRRAVEELVPASDRSGELLSIEQAEASLADDGCYLLVATRGEELAGVLSAFRFPDVECGGARAYLYNIEVRPSHRRRGIGAALVSHLISLCDADGVDLIWAGTEVANIAARRTFEATGGALEGESYAEYEWDREREEDGE